MSHAPLALILAQIWIAPQTPAGVSLEWVEIPDSAPVCVCFCGNAMRPVFDPPIEKRPPEYDTKTRKAPPHYERDLLTQ